MEALNFNRSYIRGKKRPYPRSPSFLLPISLLFLLFSFLLFLSYKHFSTSTLRTSANPLPSRFCNSQKTLAGEKFLWYAPHSGFSNQLSEFRNAVLMAAILNRTLIVPPVLDHHAVALGSCPKFRVLNPTELRFSVWNHVIDLIHSRRYVSMADIIDLSKLVSGSDIRVIDFSVFISIWCGVHIDLACSTESNRQSSSLETVRECGSLLSGNNGNVNSCVHVVDEDCRTTVWTYGKDSEDGILDSFQPDEELKKKKKISYIRTRRDVYKTRGPGSGSESATILAFGSLFTSPYKVNVVSQFMTRPRVRHMEAIVRILKYLKNAPGRGLLYKSSGHLRIEGFIDADWASSPADRHSTTGYCTFIGGNLVTWKSKKQSVVAHSSAEAEYRAMAHTAGELTWLRTLLLEFGIPVYGPTPLYCDNQAAIHIANNPVFHERTKQIKYHFIRSKVESKDISTPFVP